MVPVDVLRNVAVKGAAPDVLLAVKLATGAVAVDVVDAEAVM